jgi:hypothetical protein
MDATTFNQTELTCTCSISSELLITHHTETNDSFARVKSMPGGFTFYRPHSYLAPSKPIERRPRGPVEGFSKQSQKHLRETLMRLDMESFAGDSKEASNGTGFFITLNWSANLPWDKESLHRDLERLSKKLRRDFPSVFLGALWKKEYQKDGTPHLHLIAFFNSTLRTATIQEWADITWSAIIGRREESATDVIPLHGSMSALRAYLIKRNYSHVNDSGLGRAWGKWGKGLPFVEPEVTDLTKEGLQELLNRTKATPIAEHNRLIQLFNVDWKGGRIMGDGKELRELLVDLPSQADRIQW